MPRYRISGLTLESDITLGHLSPVHVAPADKVDVEIRLGAVEQKPEDWLAYFQAPNEDRQNLFCEPLDGLYLHIKSGNRIIVDRPPHMPDSEIALFLTGLGWGLICHQRELLPLHCSAIVEQGSAFAFTGESGAGKSTLLTGLVQRGRDGCNDDLMVTLPGHPPKIHEMRIGAKLWEDAVDFFDLTPGEQLRLRDERRKFHVRYGNQTPDAVRPLRALYILSEGLAGAKPLITPLTGSDSWMELYRSVYRVDMIPWARSPAGLARQVEQLAQSVPLFRFSRPKDFSRFAQGLDILEEHMNNLAVDDIMPVPSQQSTVTQ